MSVIYEVKCGCGCELGFSVKLDSNDDLMIDVDPCPDCKQTNFDEGKEEGTEEAKE